MPVQSRRPPRRSDAGAEGGFLQLRVSTLDAPRQTSLEYTTGPFVRRTRRGLSTLFTDDE